MINEKTWFEKLRSWIIVQKYTLQRGYGHGQIPAIGIIFASSVKGAFPGLVDNLQKFILLVVIGFVGLYFVGWLDKKFKFLHEENKYMSITNPIIMELIEEARRKKNESNQRK
jgi:UDP-N-acetylmuramyl pentapeptide phosphotransferase/UDP-N-acetylglucosamine-1-phosphate transferase